MYIRIEVALKPEFNDPKGDDFLRKVELAFPETRRKARWCRHIDVYFLSIDTQENISREKIIDAINELFRDKVLGWLFTGNLIPSAAGIHGSLQDLMSSAPERPGVFFGIEKHYRRGVTDNVAKTVREGLEVLFGQELKNVEVATGSLVMLEGPKLTEEEISRIARDIFSNELIESWTLVTDSELKKNDRFHVDQVKRLFPKVLRHQPPQVHSFDFSRLSETDLLKVSNERMLALSLAECTAIHSHYSAPETKLKREKNGLKQVTDVELEVIAQTWSEHCKHKIFNARIDYSETDTTSVPWVNAAIPARVESLFKQTIAGTTSRTPKPWLLSVFDDNAGIVAFDDEDAICIKVETHNSPSALDPYGGSLTGIVGVNRDILGTGRGAKPIFNTNVFCLASPQYSKKLPERLLHPRRILAGVRLGVEHGGNKSGIPTINGALVFDDRYIAKPLIYCGTVGMLPRKIKEEPTHEKPILKGDLVCMVGGRIGKDGIHGATVSSMGMSELTPSTFVQLGDPMTQKRMSDFLLEARNLGLYRTLTDNGAGGLSSSVGELARTTGGVRIDVSLAQVKYIGLQPYELVVSESQERMTVAVPPENKEAFTELARARAIEVSFLGEFDDSGFFHIQFRGETVAYLDLEFLHKGTPKLEIQAVFEGVPHFPKTVKLDFGKELPHLATVILKRPNVSSKEWLIRQYDHEVQGTSVIKPLHTTQIGDLATQRSGPNDSGVVKPKPNSWAGICVSNGVNAKLSDWDAHLMAQASVDEAVRNALCSGANFGQEENVFALVDNFCWPDPLTSPKFAADLVRACFGLREAALALSLPLISGKDSMKNEYTGTVDGKPTFIAVPPTLLVSALAKIDDIRLCRSSDFKHSGDAIFRIGGENFGLVGSEFYCHFVEELKAHGGNADQVVIPSTQEAALPLPNWHQARLIYSWLGGGLGLRHHHLRSVHDVSDGGLFTALAESLFARRFGAEITIPADEDPWTFCFGEGFHTFLVSVPESEAASFEADLESIEIPHKRIGQINTSGKVQVHYDEGGSRSVTLITEDLYQAWLNRGYWE